MVHGHVLDMFTSTNVSKLTFGISPRDTLHVHSGLLLLLLSIHIFVMIAVINILQLHIVLVVMAHNDHAVGLRTPVTPRGIRDALLELDGSSSGRIPSFGRSMRSAMWSSMGSSIRRQ